MRLYNSTGLQSNWDMYVASMSFSVPTVLPFQLTVLGDSM